MKIGTNRESRPPTLRSFQQTHPQAWVCDILPECLHGFKALSSVQWFLLASNALPHTLFKEVSRRVMIYFSVEVSVSDQTSLLRFCIENFGHVSKTGLALDF
jgi:hypothetical protein